MIDHRKSPFRYFKLDINRFDTKPGNLKNENWESIIKSFHIYDAQKAIEEEDQMAKEERFEKIYSQGKPVISPIHS